MKLFSRKGSVSEEPFFTRHGWAVIPATALAAVIVIAVLIVLIFSRNLPSLLMLENFEPIVLSRIYSADGKLLKELDSGEKRVRVPLDRMPESLIQATIATEDRRFFDHWGLDMPRIAKAALIDIITFSKKQGAGTITGQLARNLYLTREKSWGRKIQEAFTVLQIERTYSKPEILELYLNQMPFGNHAFGVQSASKRYFNKNVEELNTEESALLVALLKAPNTYSPYKRPEAALSRRNLVLRQLLECDYIGRPEYDSLKTVPISVIERAVLDSTIAPYFCEYVRTTLREKYGLGLYTDGLSIYTTLDTRVQKCAEQAIENFIPKLEERLRDPILRKRRFTQWMDPEMRTDEGIESFLADSSQVDSLLTARATLQTALLAIEPSTGHILAWVGGRDFEKNKFNRVQQMERQPGSSFKPFVYTVAVDNGYPTTYTLLNQPVVLMQVDGTPWIPKNFDESTAGPTTLREALRRSLNLVTARLLLEVIKSPEKVVSYAKRFGFTSTIYPYETIALGASDVKLIDMTKAFGVFANGGELVEPIAVTRVEDKYGNVIDTFTPERKEVINENTAYIMTDMLQTVVRKGTGANASRVFGFNRPAGGKTGTTNDFRNAWFVGFTPQIAAGVWVGFDDLRLSLGDNMTGAAVALPVWAPFMRAAHDSLGLAYRNFNAPPGIVRMKICDETKKLAADYCPKIDEEIFISKYAPAEHCDKHSSPTRSAGKRKQMIY